MASDFWEPNGQVFVHHGLRYGVMQKGDILQTVRLDAPKTVGSPYQNNSQPTEKPKEVVLHTPVKLSVTETVKRCPICRKTVPGKRIDRQFCSPACRQRACRGKQLELMKC